MQDMFEIKDGVLTAYLGADPCPRIPEGVHTIGDGAFKGMGWLLGVHFPSTLKKIGAGAFKGCRKLNGLSFPEGLESIGEYAFHRCHDLEHLILPGTLTRVDQCAFLYCDGLKTVVMEGPKQLAKGTFSHNLALESIALNRELDDSNFGDEVFEGCVSLHRISLSGEVYETENLIEAMDSHSAYPGIIRSIARSVFHSMSIEDGELQSFNINLKIVNVPEGVRSVGKSCFFDKKGIVSITFPGSLREIRANAFSNCIGLTEIIFQNEEVKLEEKAFRGCSALKKVVFCGREYQITEEDATGFPEFIERIRDQVFADFYISGNILIRYLGKEERIRIPKEVKIIGERAFFGNEQLKTVILPEGLTEIREQAFAGCVTLQSAVIPKSLRKVEREAFAECKKLLSCELPETMESIGEYAFRRCFCLKPFVIYPDRAVIHPFAFYLTKQMGEILNRGTTKENDFQKKKEGQENGNGAIDPSVTEGAVSQIIEPYAYARNKELRTLKLTGIRKIGKYAFASCPNLEEVEIDAPECEIEEHAFSTCPNLKKVTLKVRNLGKSTFSYCRKLSDVRLFGVSVLPAECFAGCYALGHLIISDVTGIGKKCLVESGEGNSVDLTLIRRVGERAFERCDSLKSLVLDKTECAYHAFADCAGLKKVSFTSDTLFGSGVFTGSTQIITIVFDSTPYEFSCFSDCLNHAGNHLPLRVREVIASVYSCFDIRERRILLGYSQDASMVTIPEDVEEIGQDVFRDHSRLQEVLFPKSVKRIGSHAFTMTAWLEKERKRTGAVFVNDILLDGSSCEGCVVLPAETVRVSSWCFAGNERITELVIPSDRITIEPLAFRNCLNLKKITDPKGQVYTLESVSDLNNKRYSEVVRRIFTECINCFKLDPEGILVESTGNLPHLVFPKGIRSIADGVYKDCHLLESIVLSEDTERIGKAAFENSKWLKIVSGASFVTEIGAQAFSGCRFLESIDLSDRVQRIGNRCFEHCASLREIHLSDQLSVIGERTFFRCKSLTRVCVPASVKEIASEAFAFCDGLTEVKVAKGTRIHEKAFAFSDQVVIRTYDSLENAPG